MLKPSIVGGAALLTIMYFQVPAANGTTVYDDADSLPVEGVAVIARGVGTDISSEVAIS